MFLNGARLTSRRCKKIGVLQRRRFVVESTSDGEHTVTVKLSNCNLEFCSGRLARFANGSVLLTQNENAILGTVVSKLHKGPERSSFPTNDLQMSVDYRQSAAALGRIPTNYLRRELQQTDQDIITSRTIDRSIRPIFHQNFNAQTHIVCKPLSMSENCDSAVLGINVASAALAVSSVPLRCYIAAARIGIVDSNIVVNPTIEELKASTLNMVLTGSDEQKVLMIDMDGKEIVTDVIIECYRLAFNEINQVINGIKNLETLVNRPKWEIEDVAINNELLNICELHCKQPLTEILTNYTHDKTSRDLAITGVRESFVNKFITEVDEGGKPLYNNALLSSCFGYFFKNFVKSLTLDIGIRCDGRKFDEFRPIKIQTNVYKRLHGSALFQRGQSQVFTTVTFDSPQAAFHPDSIAQLLGAQQRKSFMLHYEFPQFAVNEIGSSFGGGNRREIGHGMLAEKALKHVIPADFPYTIRLAAQVLESNGSTSLASVCAGSLALFDAGVPLKRAVAGAAIGLFSTANNKTQKDSNGNNFVFLTDLFGMEDYLGDMDFKIAGTSKGLTAMQLDLKICGLTLDQLKEALSRGITGIEHVLGKMNADLPKPRDEFKDSVPIIELWALPTHYRRSILFRRGAYNAKLVETETGVNVTAEDEHSLCLLAPNREKLEIAKKFINNLLQEQNDVNFTFGAYYKAEIVDILDTGVMVVLQKGTRPILLHNSALSNRKIGHASALGLQVGQLITVKYFGRDPQGYHRITCKMLTAPDIAVQNLIGKKT